MNVKEPNEKKYIKLIAGSIFYNSLKREVYLKHQTLKAGEVRKCITRKLSVVTYKV